MLRLRLTFTRGEEVKYISHLDLQRLWVRALKRAGIAVALSEGFNPHPRLSMAAPLAVGVTSETELLDIYVVADAPSGDLEERLSHQLPPGVAIIGSAEVPLPAPSASALLRSAEYVVTAATDHHPAEIDRDISALLAAESLPRERVREGKARAYDLRPLVHDLWLEGSEHGRCWVRMHLRAEGGATGRPEEVAAALGLGDVLAIHRTRLLLAST